MFSFVVPARNEEHHLAHCLQSIADLKLSDHSLEVIVVDNGSTDQTVAVAAAFQSRLPLSILSISKGNVSVVRNAGACVAGGTYLCFLDADIILPSTWLIDVLTAMRNAAVGIAGGPYLLPSDSSLLARAWSRVAQSSKNCGASNVSYLAAGDICVRRSQFLAIGGVDEQLATNEDYDLCRRFHEMNLAVLSIASAGVVHLGTPQTFHSFFRQHRWHARHAFAVFRYAWNNVSDLQAVAFTLWFAAHLVLLGPIALFDFTNGQHRIVLLSLLSLCFPSVLLSLRAGINHRVWCEIPMLFLLLLVYSLARTFSLFGISPYRKWRDHTVQSPTHTA